MKKKLLVFLVALCLALGAGTTLTAFAGVNHNSPTGDGLMSGGDLIIRIILFVTTASLRHTAFSKELRFTICPVWRARTTFRLIR